MITGGCLIGRFHQLYDEIGLAGISAAQPRLKANNLIVSFWNNHSPYPVSGKSATLAQTHEFLAPPTAFFAAKISHQQPYTAP